MTQHPVVESTPKDRNTFDRDVFIQRLYEEFVGDSGSQHKRLFTSFASTETSVYDSPEKLAADATIVGKELMEALRELNKVDTYSSGQLWAPRWDGLRANYTGLIKGSIDLSTEGIKYITNFDNEVVKRFSKDFIDWERDKTLISDFIKKPDGEHLVKSSQGLSQGFTDYRREVESFRSDYSDFVVRQNRDYESNLKKLHGDMDKLRAEISRLRSLASQIERALWEITGLAFLSWLIAKILGALGLASEEEAHRTLDTSYRQIKSLQEEQEKVRKEADDIARQHPIILQVRHALDVLARNVADIIERLDNFAYSWSLTHKEIVLLGEELKNSSTSASRSSFKRRLDIVAKSNSMLVSDMQKYIQGIVSEGLDDMPGVFVVSRQFGDSDTSKGYPFNDAYDIINIDPRYPIERLTVYSGWVVDGIEIVYRLRGGGTRSVSHGSTTPSGKKVSQLNLSGTECIETVTGKSGFADNGYPFMGDCVQVISFGVLNYSNNQRRSFGPFGLGKDLSYHNTTMIDWKGRLYALAGRASDTSGQVGLRGIAFVKHEK